MRTVKAQLCKVFSQHWNKDFNLDSPDIVQKIQKVMSNSIVQCVLEPWKCSVLISDNTNLHNMMVTHQVGIG